MTFSTLISGEDLSVNHVVLAEDGGAYECRFVRRRDEYFIVYLSSHSGCDRACRMCHLTQTGQTMMRPATYGDYVKQARTVLKHWFLEGDWRNVPEFINFNFMARGEPFANEKLWAPPFENMHGPIRMIDALEKRLTQETLSRGVKRAQFNYSTIMPASLPDRPLASVLGRAHRDRNIYYSLYSLKADFRRRWLPKAMNPLLALDRLAEYQRTGIDFDDGRGPQSGEIVLHWSFIKGQNDDDETVDQIIEEVLKRGMKTRFNCVRYNPFSPAQGEEPDEETLQRLTDKLSAAFGDPRTRIVPRVGFDVKASCGMFLAPAEVAALKES